MNTKQKIAVLASGLVIATTGFVTDGPTATRPDPQRHAASATQTSATTTSPTGSSTTSTAP